MTFRIFPYNFHDAQLIDYQLGPRQEVTLHIALDPVWNHREERVVIVRFGAIRNYDQVSEFFNKIKRPEDADRSMADIIGIVHSGAKKDVILIDLNLYGSIEILSTHATMA